MPMLVLDLSSIDGLEVEAGRDGGDRNIYEPIARLPPGHDPGAEAGGMATTALQRGLWP